MHLATLALVSLGSSAAYAEGSAQAGQAKAATCVACHGVDGNSVNPEWPSIAGQHSTYIVKQLKAFKSGVRQNVLMTPMASRCPITLEASHLLPSEPRASAKRKEQVEAGKTLSRGILPALQRLHACHGPMSMQ